MKQPAEENKCKEPFLKCLCIYFCFLFIPAINCNVAFRHSQGFFVDLKQSLTHDHKLIMNK